MPTTSLWPCIEAEWSGAKPLVVIACAGSARRSRSVPTTLPCPNWAAMKRGVAPSFMACAGSARRSRSVPTTLPCPNWAAMKRGVAPSFSAALTDAWCSHSRVTMSLWPAWPAQWSGVKPSALAAPGGTPFFRSCSADLCKPSNAASASSAGAGASSGRPASSRVGCCARSSSRPLRAVHRTSSFLRDASLASGSSEPVSPVQEISSMRSSCKQARSSTLPWRLTQPLALSSSRAEQARRGFKSPFMLQHSWMFKTRRPCNVARGSKVPQHASFSLITRCRRRLHCGSVSDMKLCHASDRTCAKFVKSNAVAGTMMSLKVSSYFLARKDLSAPFVTVLFSSSAAKAFGDAAKSRDEVRHCLRRKRILRFHSLFDCVFNRKPRTSGRHNVMLAGFERKDTPISNQGQPLFS
mmetsp:Transcript_10248/g.32502  ORF Transcript_10248/g.32502 Transcript_10248/m.32502 type:complete len:410 (+) Transcript_10248:272-1501(+)